MAETPYQAPYQGYSWAGQPPASANPWITAGTSMIQDYAIMRQNQEIAQYQQQIMPPPFMSLPMQHSVAFSPQYNYGVVGGQSDVYRNSIYQTHLTAGAFATSAGMMAMSTPFFMGGMRAAGSMMDPGLLAGVVGMGIGGVAAYPFTAIAERGIARARWTADIASDISQYAPRYTQGVGFGMSATSALSDQIMRSMQDTPGFFRAQDQLKIFKMGLSSGMIRGGSTEEFKKNFEDLKSNAKDIIQMLNTTIEGGMSVMKELQSAGFSSPAQIRAQVANAKAMGMTSGIGTQNMLSLGAAGAQRAVGTGWSPTAAASMYQTMGAVTAGMAQTNPAFAEAVRNSGGIANAGANVAGGMMNAIRSGMGIQTMAYLMDPTSKQVDRDRLLKLASGRVDPLELINGANRYGMSGGRGGANNRALVVRDMMRNVNKMSPEELALTFSGIYRTWASERGGADEASAYVFAKKFGRDETTTDLLSQMLTNPMRLADLQLGRDRTDYMSRVTNIPVWRNPVSQALYDANRAVQGGLNAFGDMAYGGFQNLAMAGGRIIQGLNMSVKSRLWFETNRYSPSATTAGNVIGATRISAVQAAALGKAGFGADSVVRFGKLQSGMLGDVDIAKRAKSMSNTELQQTIDEMHQVVNSAGANLAGSPRLSASLGINGHKNALSAGNSRNVQRQLINTLIEEARNRNEVMGNDRITKTYDEWKSDPGNNKFAKLNQLWEKTRDYMAANNVSADVAVERVGMGYAAGQIIRMSFQGRGAIKTGNAYNTALNDNERAQWEASKKYFSGKKRGFWDPVTGWTIGARGGDHWWRMRQKQGSTRIFGGVAEDRQADLASDIAGINFSGNEQEIARQRSAINVKYNLSKGGSAWLSDIIDAGRFGNRSGADPLSVEYLKNARSYVRGQAYEASTALAGAVSSIGTQIGLKPSQMDSVFRSASDAFNKNVSNWTPLSIKGLDAQQLVGSGYGFLLSTNREDFKKGFVAKQDEMKKAAEMDAGNQEAIKALTAALESNTKELEGLGDKDKVGEKGQKIAEKRAELMDKLKNLQSNVSDDKTLQNSATAPAQSATPQILGYWNNQWNVLGR